MKAQHFVEKLDEHRIVAAIGEAERKSSGEIRVYVTHRKRPDALAAAKARFLKLGMANTRERNAVLIYFAPATHQFAVVGDVRVNEKCGENFWHEIVEEMTPLLKANQFTEAVMLAIEHLGRILAQHFPRQPDDRNELPDQIVRD